MLPGLLLLLSGLALAAALRELPMRARGGRLHAERVAREAARDAALGIVSNSTVNWFTQRVWHNASADTFQQRYYVDATFWQGNADADVFLYIGGEGPLGGTPGGAVAELASARKALVFALEHRYYGDSFPSDLSDRATLTSLTVENALEDLAAFIQATVAARGLTGKWLVIGGSYPGALSSWFRQKYPALAAASWSSSGVVNAVYAFSQFDAQVLLDVSPECAAALHAATAAFDARWDDPATRPALLALLGTPAYFSKADTAWMLGDSAGMAAQYGAKAALCAAMLPSTDPLPQFVAFTKEHYGAAFTSSCYYSTTCLSSPSMSSQWIGADWQWVRGAGGRGWHGAQAEAPRRRLTQRARAHAPHTLAPSPTLQVYQCCRQLAYWNIAGPGSQRSAAVTVDYFNAQCQAAMGFDPHTSGANAAFNAEFGGAAPTSNSTIALNGSDDPWKNAAVQASLRPEYPEFTATCDGCGHCGDLSGSHPSEDPAITVQHAAIAAYVAKWLA
jgi:hypothetical protein